MTGFSGVYDVFFNTNASDPNLAFLNSGPAESPGSGAGVMELDLAGLQGQGFEKHGYAADPEWSVPFASIAGDPTGFLPKKTSVAVDHGTMLAYVADYAGHAIPEGKGPDIGAFEQ